GTERSRSAEAEGAEHLLERTGVLVERLGEVVQREAPTDVVLHDDDLADLVGGAGVGRDRQVPLPGGGTVDAGVAGRPGGEPRLLVLGADDVGELLQARAVAEVDRL